MTNSNEAKPYQRPATWMITTAAILALWPLLARFENLDFAWRYRMFVDEGFDDGPLQILNALFWFFRPIAEPLVLLTAVLSAWFVSIRALRALPGLLFSGGFLAYMLTVQTLRAQGKWGEADIFVFLAGPQPQSSLYISALALALAGSLTASFDKRPFPLRANLGISEANFTVKPVGFDTETGRPILRYDEETGKPIYLD